MEIPLMVILKFFKNFVFNKILRGIHPHLRVAEADESRPTMGSGTEEKKKPRQPQTIPFKENYPYVSYNSML